MAGMWLHGLSLLHLKVSVEISSWSDRPDDMRPSEGEALAVDFEKDLSSSKLITESNISRSCHAVQERQAG